MTVDLAQTRRPIIGLILGAFTFFGLLFLWPGKITGPLPYVASMSVLMAIWWSTEAVPMAVTAMIPPIFLPLTGHFNLKEVLTPYAHPIIFLFLAGFVLAKGMERWNLHRRLALRTLLKFSHHTHTLTFGYMLVTAFLSMWVSNTATTLMVLPVVKSSIELLEKRFPKKIHSISLGLLLGVAYSASIGGLGTIIGTPPNTLLAAFVRDELGEDLSFAKWILVGLPISLTLLVVLWIMLTRVLFPHREAIKEGDIRHLKQEYLELGPMGREEKLVTILLTLTGIGLMIRPLLTQWTNIPLTDTSIALMGMLSLFVFPTTEKGDRLMNWEWALKIPWGILLLFGGGLSLARSIQSSGLAKAIGHSLVSLASQYPDWMIILLLTALVMAITEMTSNVATTAIFMPIATILAHELGLHPMRLLIPMVLASSCAFMFPVATAPNALVYGLGRVPIQSMIRAGLWMNLLALTIISFLTHLLVPNVF